MTWSLVINYFVLLPLCAVLCYFLIRRVPGSEESLSWQIFYTAYFTVLFYVIVLPIPFHSPWKPLSPGLVFSTLDWNPFGVWIDEWRQAMRVIPAGKVEPLLHFFQRHLGNFLLLMPLADFLYSAMPKINRRQCFAMVFLLSIAIEFLQFWLIVLTGRFYVIAELTDVFSSSLGAAFFLVLSALTEEQRKKRGYLFWMGSDH